MDDFILEQEMIYEGVLEAHCEPHRGDYFPCEPKIRTSKFDITKPMLMADIKPYLNQYHVKGFNWDSGKVVAFDFPSVEATSSTEAETIVQEWMNWGAKITSCRRV